MKKVLLLGMVFWLTLLSCVYGSYADIKGEHSGTSLISLKLDGQKVGGFVQNISKQANYTIHIEEGLKSEIVFGNYIDVSIEQFFHRIFKQKNIVVDIDSYSKIIIVRQFGSSVTLSGTTESSFKKKVALSDVSVLELGEIFLEEDRIYQAWREDPDAILPFSNVTKKEYEELVLSEAMKYEEEKQDPARKIALSDVTRQEAQEIFKAEGERALLTRQNADKNIALSYMTHSEVMKRLEAEGYVENDPSRLIPFSSITYAEFHISKE